jgi:hypothetical protein
LTTVARTGFPDPAESTMRRVIHVTSAHVGD